jgi:hypothetical protein
MDTVAHTCNLSAQEAEEGISRAWGQPGLQNTFQASLSSKSQTRGCDTQVVECLPSKHKAEFHPQYLKKKKKKAN